MPSKPKARKCFCGWKGLFKKGRKGNQINQKATIVPKSNKVIRVPSSIRSPVQTQTSTGCFQQCPDTKPNNNKQKVLSQFKNWQGIYIDSVKFNRAQTSVMKYDMDCNFVCLNSNSELRRCFNNWQGIYLGFMDLNPNDEAVSFKDSLDFDSNKKSFEKKPSFTLTVEHVFRNSDTRSQTFESSMQTEPDISTPQIDQDTINPDTKSKPHSDQDITQDTSKYHKTKHHIATNTERDQQQQQHNKRDPRHSKMNSSIPLKKEQDTTAIERHLESLQQQEKEKLYTDDYKAALVSLVLDKKISVAQVANNADVPHSTLLNWVNLAREKICAQPSFFKLEHKQYLIDFIDENPTAVLNEALESLAQKFPGLNAKKTHIQEFMKNECNIKVLKTDVPNRKEIKMNLQNRIQWVNQWSHTDLDYMKNCVFIECPRLDVVMKSGGLPYKKSGLNVTPRYFFVAVSAVGIVETCMFHPGIKREDPYVEFLNAILDKMDRSDELEGSYVVMNNMHDWLLDDLEKIVVDRGYQCAYLPPYCSDLNPITKFWTSVKYGINRHYLLDGETIAHRINQSKANVLQSEIEGFIQHSKKYFTGHLNKPNA
ncbi:hypothetical protein INT47_007628 [Mucor saturninus]|uniref:Tc1-like transposase DDE domain-containing protein n=1 Tax=Mucor saturninus TaxID=64648 RepID=A0A8H7V1Q1_9FUNG|nr:hypothetical protein INT47_007628 [Mucor saturninus]